MTTNRDDDDGSGRLRWLLGVAAGVGLLLILVWWPGCRKYPPVSGPESVGLAELVYSACNTRDPARLARAEQSAADLARRGKLTPAEHEAFADILAAAKAGEWDDAQAEALRFVRDQVGRGGAAPPASHDHKPAGR